MRLQPPAVGIASVRGLRAAAVAAGIKASGSADVALLVMDRPASAAGIFTKNALAAAPVTLCRAHLERTGGRVAAVVVSSGNANACTGARGERDARAMADGAARLVGCDVAEVLVFSTGVIGVPLPIDRVLAGIDAAFGELSTGDAASRAFAGAIRTTDAFPKEAGETLDAPPGAVVAGACKGAGMIEPDMATMLAFVATDVDVDAASLRSAIGPVAAGSFNAIHVDSHASTNDSFVLLATGASGPPDEVAGQAAPWSRALERVARRLAWLIVRDGEGATKVTRIRVTGAPGPEAAADVARRIARSALVRTALFGNDPNWGRFVSAAGTSPHVADASRMRCVLQGTPVFDRGQPLELDAAALGRTMAAEEVELVLDLGSGAAEAEVLTSDLGYRYVEINAEYTT